MVILSVRGSTLDIRICLHTSDMVRYAKISCISQHFFGNMVQIARFWGWAQNKLLLICRNLIRYDLTKYANLSDFVGIICIKLVRAVLNVSFGILVRLLIFSPPPRSERRHYVLGLSVRPAIRLSGRPSVRSCIFVLRQPGPTDWIYNLYPSGNFFYQRSRS